LLNQEEPLRQPLAPFACNRKARKVCSRFMLAAKLDQLFPGLLGFAAAAFSAGGAVIVLKPIATLRTMDNESGDAYHPGTSRFWNLNEKYGLLRTVANPPRTQFPQLVIREDPPFCRYARFPMAW
jgi:hypothetical protein